MVKVDFNIFYLLTFVFIICKVFGNADISWSVCFLPILIWIGIWIAPIIATIIIDILYF